MSLIAVTCPGCGANHPRLVYRSTLDGRPAGRYCYGAHTDGHHAIVRCSKCGLHYASPRDASSALASMYASGSEDRSCEETALKLASLRADVRELTHRCGSGGTLLEIGCASGLFLQAAQEAGFSVYGCDPCIEPAELAASQFPGHIHIGPFDVHQYRSGQFRVIVMLDVIEHVESPLALLGNAATLLSPGGWMVLSTPDFGSFSRRLLRHRWHFLEREHLTFFDRRQLTNSLRTVGLTVLDSRTQWKTQSLTYLARYGNRWSPRVSRVALKMIKTFAPNGTLALRLPTGGMWIYAQAAKAKMRPA